METVPITEAALFAVMKEALDEQAIRYNEESLKHYVHMRFTTAHIAGRTTKGGVKPGDPYGITRQTIRKSWVSAFLAKYN